MLTTSFTTRGVHFAYLIGPPKTLSRQQGMEIYDAVSEKLGVDDISFRYSSTKEDESSSSRRPSSDDEGRGFAIHLERKQGRGGLRLTIDNSSINRPVRFLAQYTWPPSREHVREDIDLAAGAVWGCLNDEWQKVMAETRIRAQLEAQADSAVSYLTREVLHLSDSKLGSLGTSASFAGVRVDAEAGDPVPGDSLANPKREFKVEVLREDPKCLYVELMSQWPQVASSGSGSLEIDAQRIRSFDAQPSAYVKDSQEWLMEIGLPLFQRSDQ